MDMLENITSAFFSFKLNSNGFRQILLKVFQQRLCDHRSQFKCYCPEDSPEGQDTEEEQSGSKPDPV